MKETIKKYWKIFLIIIFILVDCSVWWVVQNELPENFVTVAFLNTGGKGETVYIESPTHTRILIDGGPSHTLLPELRNVVPFYIRSLDMFLFTDFNANNYAGMLDVFPLYHISKIIEPDVLTTKTDSHISSPLYTQFENAIQAQKIPATPAQQGMIIHLGGGADIYFSSSIEFSYGSTSLAFTGINDEASILESLHISTSAILKNKNVILKMTNSSVSVSYQ